MSLLSVVCPVDVLLMSFSQSASLPYPHSFSHSHISRSFLIHRQSPLPPPFLGYCLCLPLCASVGNSAFPVILLVGWLSVDFVQTVGSALREGLLDLQSLPIMLSSFKQPVDNRQPPSATPATHKANHWHIVAGFYGECSFPLLLRLIVLERLTLVFILLKKIQNPSY